MHWKQLNDNELLAVYETAKNAQLEIKFIKLLEEELKRRIEIMMDAQTKSVLLTIK